MSAFTVYVIRGRPRSPSRSDTATVLVSSPAPAAAFDCGGRIVCALDDDGDDEDEDGTAWLRVELAAKLLGAGEALCIDE